MIHSAPPRRQGITPSKPFGRDTFSDNDEDDERRQTTAEASSFLSHMARRKNGTPVNQKWKKAAHVAALQAWREWK